ncbi:hypothetical protein [Brevundimonas sp.]
MTSAPRILLLSVAVAATLGRLPASRGKGPSAQGRASAGRRRRHHPGRL